MCQTIYFPAKFTYGVGLGVNTCERARAAKFPLRGAEIEVQMQKGTLQIYTVKQKVPGDTKLVGGKEVVATVTGETPDHSSCMGTVDASSNRGANQYIWLIGLIGSCSCP